MKTVVVVVNTSWNIYNFRLNLMRALRDEGFNVLALAPYDAYSDKLRAEGFDWVHLPLDNDSTNLFRELQQIKDFYKLYREIQPDIVLHYTVKPNLYGTFAAMLLKVPSINNISGLGTVFIREGWVYTMARFLYRVVLRFPKKVFFQNHHDRQLFIDKQLIKAGISEVIPGSGVDSQRFSPREHPKRDNEAVTFLMIARLIRDKGIGEYMDAIKILREKYPQVCFQLIGSLYPGNPSAVSEETLMSWMDEGLIEYLPFSNSMQEVIANVDCVVLPSYREGLSRVLLEAASMAKPIVTSNVAGCKDVVDDGVNGFLCDVKDASSLAKQMEKMITMTHEERKEMGKKGREKILHEFDERLVIEKYLESINNILK